MASALYDFGRESFLAGSLDWDANTIKLTLIDEADDVPDLALDQDYADRAVAARVAVSAALGSKTTTAGVADAADTSFSSATGDQSESFDIWYDSTVEATSTLIANIDDATGLPVTPNGGDINVTWDNGANKIFKL